MPVVTSLGYFTRPEELVEYLDQIVGDSTLPFEYIAKYDEVLIPKYPAVQISAGPLDKTVHGTHTNNIALRAYLYVYHANLTQDHRTRSLEDLLLATQLVELIEGDRTLGGHVINGLMETETPAAFPPRTAKGSAVVGTRLMYTCLTQKRFK